jgi:hypothetical protein
MKYPKHLILDLQPTHTSKQGVVDSWQIAFLRIGAQGSLIGTAVPFKSLRTYETKFKNLPTSQRSRTLTLPLFDVHFIRKERLYTKLKYSRCPQYDIVSGGFAAIFAGFIGFLISEKFGIELVDSADFYNAFMYGVFCVFFSRPLIRIYSKDNTPYHPLSLKYIITFYRDLTHLVLSLVQRIRRYFF